MLRDSVDNVDIWNVTYWEHVRKCNTERWKTGSFLLSLFLDIFLKKLHYILYFLQNTRKEKTIFLQILLTSKDTCTLNSEESSRLHRLLSLYQSSFDRKILDLLPLLWIETYILIVSINALNRTRWNQRMSSRCTRLKYLWAGLSSLCGG